MTRFNGNESNVYIIGEKRQDPFSDDLHDKGVLVSLTCQYSSHLTICTLMLDP